MKTMQTTCCKRFDDMAVIFINKAIYHFRFSCTKKSFPLKQTRNTHGTLKTHVTPIHVLLNTRVPRNDCWSILS